MANRSRVRNRARLGNSWLGCRQDAGAAVSGEAKLAELIERVREQANSSGETWYQAMVWVLREMERLGLAPVGSSEFK